jgi:hypothetical protein
LRQSSTLLVTAQKLDLAIPQSVLFQADKIIR